MALGAVSGGVGRESHFGRVTDPNMDSIFFGTSDFGRRISSHKAAFVAFAFPKSFKILHFFQHIEQTDSLANN